ncbi:MAG TPA: mechanosensitive ion channel family protein [Gammaproteobacteria bacterium]|nr:mechanosensitive ion channel family protein [Gammaproteobacteria bacterium]
MLHSAFWKDVLAFYHDWSWLFWAAAIVFVCAGVNFVVQRVFQRFVQRLARKSAALWDDALVEALNTPLQVFIWIIGVSVAAHIAIAGNPQSALAAVFHQARAVAIIGDIAWFALRFSVRLQRAYALKRNRRGEAVDVTAVDALGKLARASIVIVAVLVALQTLGFSISGLLAFGGIGGIAVGFAAQGFVANLFGGFTVYTARPFKVGEWIVLPQQNVMGTVQEIGWRTTRVLSFDRRPYYVPNSLFNTAIVENGTRMLNRRIFETVGIRYDDIERMQPILDDVRGHIAAREDIDHGQSVMVNFDTYAASSLNIVIYCFTRTIDWSEYKDVKEDLLLKIADIVLGHGAEFAFPTQTVHVPDGLGVSGLPSRDRA